MHMYKQTCIETAENWKMLIQIEKEYLRVRVFISLISKYVLCDFKTHCPK